MPNTLIGDQYPNDYLYVNHMLKYIFVYLNANFESVLSKNIQIIHNNAYTL